MAKYFPYLDGAQIQENMDAVAAYAGVDWSTLPTRKSRFMNSIQQLQGSFLKWHEDDIHLEFSDRRIADFLLRTGVLTPDDLADDHYIISEASQRNVADYLRRAMGVIKSVHPGLHFQINELIGTISIFKQRGTGGGSISSFIGHVWISPIKRWTVLDYGEALYHEFIHNALFLDDMVHQIFVDATKLDEADAMVTSAILKIRRPLDRSFHASCVAIGLMHYYWMLHDLPKSESYREPLAVTVGELNQKTHYLADRGKEILVLMNEFLEHPDYPEMSEGLGAGALEASR